MDLVNYFKNIKGKGVLATADDQGHVDVALYARPHIIDKDTVAFIMPDHLTHQNLQANIHAAYLFIEEGPGYKGIRLFLSKVREEEDSELLRSIRRRAYATEQGGKETSRFLVFFEVTKILSLIGPGKEE
jgi:hypothetical protein